MKNIKTVLFDLDGVLINSWPFIVASFRHVANIYNLDVNMLLNDPRMRSCTLKEAYEILGVHPSQFPMYLAAHLEFQNNNLHMVKPFPQALPLLSQVRREFRTGVITNRIDNGPKLLQYCGLFESIEYIVGAEDVTKGKPHPEGILKALTHFGVSPGETVMVGDTNADILAGNAAGIWTVALTTSNCLRSLQMAEPHYYIDSLDELRPILGI